MNDIHRQLCSYVVAETDQITPEKTNTYILAKSGVFLMRDTPIGRFCVKYDGSIPGLANITPKFEMKLAKVPFPYFLSLWKFFRTVYEKYETEASAFIYYDNQTNQYEMHVPEQTVSSGSVKHTKPTFGPEKTLLIEAHSHGSMSAFFSQTDDADEQAACIYMVMGNMDKDFPSVQIRARVANGCVPLTLSDVFDFSVVCTEDQMTAWMSRITVAEKPKLTSLFGGLSRRERYKMFDLSGLHDPDMPQASLFSLSDKDDDLDGHSVLQNTNVDDDERDGDTHKTFIDVLSQVDLPSCDPTLAGQHIVRNGRIFVYDNSGMCVGWKWIKQHQKKKRKK